jgi:two-component system, LytTR family, sensor kinase
MTFPFISIFKNNRFPSWIPAIWLLWTALHIWVATEMGYSLRVAVIESLTYNLLLAFAAVLVINILKYYTPGKGRYINLIALTIAIAFIWYVSSRSVLFALFNNETGSEDFWGNEFTILIPIAFLVLGCVALIFVLVGTMEDRERQIHQKADAEKLAREAELFRLQQQLQPHFLFNSLNSISALVGTDPALARKMIQQLSEFLRGTLKKDDQQQIPLQEELHQLSLYLDIEKIRFGHRLQTEINISENAIDSLIPALLLQPIVENAIKFGLYDTTGDVLIQIHANKENNQLHITVSNPFDPETASPTRGTGFGLASVQRRLYLLFGRNDILQTLAKDNQFITTIIIPQHD